jgi:hypothetical protein
LKGNGEYFVAVLTKAVSNSFFPATMVVAIPIDAIKLLSSTFGFLFGESLL